MSRSDAVNLNCIKPVKIRTEDLLLRTKSRYSSFCRQLIDDEWIEDEEQLQPLNVMNRENLGLRWIERDWISERIICLLLLIYWNNESLLMLNIWFWF